MTSPVAPGDVLAGKYRVERVLGEGGMGVVVAAEHLELGQRVALKFLLEHAALDEDAATRFLREARAVVRIQSEHVARVIDVGRLENGAPYMVMEYLDGRDLAKVVSEGPLPVEDAVDYLLQACEALAEAHAAGIIHRDLKPANLFLTKRRDQSAFVKVLDFGISKLMDTAEAGLTKTDAIMGSPFYLSPEQAKSARSVDARTDLWALGAILHELLAGKRPFVGESFTELLAAILMEEPRSLREARPDVPEELDAIVRRCLAKDPSHRFANVAELAQALAPFAPPRSRISIDRISKVLGVPDAAPDTEPLAMDGLADTVPDDATIVDDAGPPASETGPLPSAAKTATAWTEESTAERSPEKRSRGVVAFAAVAIAGVGLGALVVGRSIRGPDATVVAPSGHAAALAAEPSATPATPASPALSSSAAPAQPRVEPALPAQPRVEPALQEPTDPAALARPPKSRGQARAPAHAGGPAPQPAKTAPPNTLDMEIK